MHLFRSLPRSAEELFDLEDILFVFFKEIHYYLIKFNDTGELLEVDLG